jgi:hypothetical protein
MAPSTATLVSDDNRNPMHLVLGTYPIIQWYVKKVQDARPKWPSMKVTDRMKFLADLALEILEALRIPQPDRLGSTQSMGAFEPSTWSIYLVKPLFAKSDWEDIADQAGHVFHEFEHLAATYVAARYLAAQQSSADDIFKALEILPAIARAAASDPLPQDLMDLGKDCHFRITSEKSPGHSNDYYRNLHANIRKAQAEIRSAEENLSKLEKSSHFSTKSYADAYARRRALDKSLAAAQREYQLSNTEVGSNLVENIVKSVLLRTAAAGR